MRQNLLCFGEFSSLWPVESQGECFGKAGSLPGGKRPGEPKGLELPFVGCRAGAGWASTFKASSAFASTPALDLTSGPGVKVPGEQGAPGLLMGKSCPLTSGWWGLPSSCMVCVCVCVCMHTPWPHTFENIRSREAALRGPKGPGGGDCLVMSPSW